jgi:tetratricopeptide (TPR) repeat protein
MNLLIFSSSSQRFCLNICKWYGLFFIWFLPCDFRAQETKNDTLSEEQRIYLDALKLIDSARYKESIILFKKVIKINPYSTEAYNKMAFAKIKLKDYKGAEKDLLLSDKLQAMNYETCKLKGMNFYLAGKYKEAKPELDTALYISKEEKIDDAELHYYRALLMFKGKSYKTALEALESATELQPKYTEAYLLKGEVRFVMKNYNYAIKELTEAIRLMPETKPIYSAYKLRAKSRFEMGDYKGAVQDWNVYIEGNPGEEESLILRGASKINAGDNSGAVTDLDAAIKINAKNPVSYCYRGVAKGGNKMYTEAIKDLDYAIKLKFDYAAAFVNRAAIKMALKDKRGACEDLKKADSLGDEMALKLVEKYCKQD